MAAFLPTELVTLHLSTHVVVLVSPVVRNNVVFIMVALAVATLCMIVGVCTATSSILDCALLLRSTFVTSAVCSCHGFGLRLGTTKVAFR